jgi:hypothetical protein
MFSLAIFGVGYSIARAIMAILITSSLYMGSYENFSSISPDVVVASYRTYLGGASLSDPLSLRVRAIENALTAQRKAPSAETERALISRTLEMEYSDPRLVRAALATGRLRCLRDLSFSKSNEGRLYEIIRASEYAPTDRSKKIYLGIKVV